MATSSRLVRYVNGLLNAAYLTGFVRNPKKKTLSDGTIVSESFDLQGDNNSQHNLTILVRPDFKLPREFQAVTVLCHISGAYDEKNQREIAEIHGFELQNPSTRAMPESVAWMKGGGKKYGTDEFKPFDTNGNIKTEYLLTVKQGDEEKSIIDILGATNGRLGNRMGSRTNIIQLVGFIEKIITFRQTEFEKERALVLIRQKENGHCIPVQIVAPSLKSVINSISPGQPVKVNQGRIRRKFRPTHENPEVIDPGSITVFVETDNLFRPSDADMLAIPDFFPSMILRLRQQKEEQLKAGKLAQEAALKEKKTASATKKSKPQEEEKPIIVEEEEEEVIPVEDDDDWDPEVLLDKK